MCADKEHIRSIGQRKDSIKGRTVAKLFLAIGKRQGGGTIIENELQLSS